jgi:hypothetical protein
MSNNSPLIQTLSPERFVGWSMDFIGAGYTGLLVKNGRVVRTLVPGRHFSFALPLLEQCQLILVDTKVRNLEIMSHGDFLSRDQFLLNLSLSIMYQVVDPKRVALELSEPITALTSAITDSVGVAISQFSMQQLMTQGRVQLRQYLLDHAEVTYSLGFSLEDVRISDISFPQSSGVIRQVEGMSARQEAEHLASLQAQIAEAGRPIVQPPIQPTTPVQQVNLISHQAALSNPASWLIESDATLSELQRKLDQPVLAPTVLGQDEGDRMATLVHRLSGTVIILSANPFTIGREPSSNLVLEDPLCSRNHAQIRQVHEVQGQTQYQLVDVGSSNGTFVDNQRLAHNQPFRLSPGHIIKIGNQEWTFSV